MTNFEKIKQMTVEEMASFIKRIACGDGCDCCNCYEENCYTERHCVKGRISWLNQEAEE